MQVKRIIVFGASGRTGKSCCLVALAYKHHVTAVIRKAEQIPEFEKKGINTALFDIARATPRAYVDLFNKHRPDVVIWAAGTEDDSLARDIDYQPQVNIYDAMRQVGVNRVLVVSSMGLWEGGKAWWPGWYDDAAKKRVGEIRRDVPSLVKAKYEAELHLRSLDLQYTIIRPGDLTDEPAAGSRIGKVGVGSTSRELVAQVAVDSISLPGMFKRTIDLLDGAIPVKEGIDQAIQEDIDTWTGV